MSETFHPQVPVTKEEDSADEVTMGREAIQLMDNGSDVGYYGKKDTGGTPLSDKEIAGIIQHGKNCPKMAKKVVAEVRAEKKKLTAVNPSDHTTATSYKDALAAVAKYDTSQEWYDAMLIANEVSTWADLKAKFDSLKAVVAEK